MSSSRVWRNLVGEWVWIRAGVVVVVSAESGGDDFPVRPCRSVG